ncbi:MAG: type III PLP-dependent enzyme [Pseudomonadota bacterium]
MDQFDSADQITATLSPSDPVICTRPHAAQRSAAWFTSRFPGTVLFAVKANPDPAILSAVAEGGIAHFDVASLQEVRAVHAQFSDAPLAFMHPVKSAEAIAAAYHDHGVRIFALDDEVELSKILNATNMARDLTLCVRLKVDNAQAQMPLAHKFGVQGARAVTLMQKTRQYTAQMGISFHVGSQTMHPTAFTTAMDTVDQLIVSSGVLVDVVNVGGGFPASYPGMEPPALDRFVEGIARRFERFLSTGNATLWCEPGRALCAEAQSLVVRVEARRGNQLYLNDGVYGALYDAGHFSWRYPVRALGEWEGAPMQPFSFYGPTCDDADYMPGPFLLPADIGDGDYIEVGMIGAYGRSMASPFNGFGHHIDAVCKDDPFGSLYFPATTDRYAEISI